MKIETKRLILDEVQVKHAKEIADQINNINVTKWLLVVPYPYKIKDAHQWIKNVERNRKKKPRTGYSFCMWLKSERKVIGGISLNTIETFQKKATVGYWIGESYWRQGYGSEALEALIGFAFNKLKLNRLEAGVFVGNPSSGRLLEKYGFVCEGTKRKACICKADGLIKDELIYGMLKEEWKRKSI